LPAIALIVADVSERASAVNTFVSGGAAPLTIITTTEGIGRQGIARELYDYALAVEHGDVQDESFLPVLYQAPVDCDWCDEAIWRAVNPALAAGFRSLEEMRITARRAAESPIARESFRRLYLNVWLDASEQTWVDMDVYDECAGNPVTLADFEGRPALAVDLASVQDLAALVLVAPDGDGWLVWSRQYCPEVQIKKRSAAGLRYPEWLEAGELVATSGNVIDQDPILSDIISICCEEVDELRKRVAALEAKLEGTSGVLCPLCHSPDFRIVASGPDPTFGEMGVLSDRYRCGNCQHEESRQRDTHR